MRIIKGINLSISINRMLGVTKIKQKFAKVTGVPTTSKGRQMKIGRLFGIK